MTKRRLWVLFALVWMGIGVHWMLTTPPHHLTLNWADALGVALSVAFIMSISSRSRPLTRQLRWAMVLSVILGVSTGTMFLVNAVEGPWSVYCVAVLARQAALGSFGVVSTLDDPTVTTT